MNKHEKAALNDLLQWRNETQRLDDVIALQRERIRVLEAALRQIRNEAKDCDVLIYDIARDALEPPE